MRRLIPTGLLRREEGATAVIVVLCLVAMFGMLVLVVDVGGLLLKRRALVNGSDSAALAAAKTCVLDASQDPSNPEAVADAWALKNANSTSTGGQNIVAQAGCRTASGYVTVRYTSPQQLFFAPVLGFSDQGNVTTSATAVWGPVGAANPLPIVVYKNNFNACRLDQDPTPGPNCHIWEDNNNTQGAQSGFGFLDLRTDDPGHYGWGSDPGVACPDPGGDIDTWLRTYPSADVGDLSIVYPDPTYVCRAGGNKQNAWAELEKLIDDDDVADQDDDEDILFLPINRCESAIPGTDAGGQIDKDGNEVACGDTPHQYDIIGFAAVKLIKVLDPMDAGTTGDHCSAEREMPGVENPFSLDTFGTFNGCFTDAPDTISNVTVERVQPTPQPNPVENVDWTYDPLTRSIRWLPSGPAEENPPGTYRVQFDWSNEGECGVPPAGNQSGHCLVVQVQKVQIGGSRPGEGAPDSNLRAYKLCDPAVTKSCDPIQVP